MAGIERLVETARLDFAPLERSAKSDEPVFLRYDDGFDALVLMSVPPTTETTVHYLTDQVAVLYDQSLNVVGIQVEDFVAWFLPEHKELKRVWERSYKSRDAGELVSTADRVKPQVAKELIRLAEPMMETA